MMQQHLGKVLSSQSVRQVIPKVYKCHKLLHKDAQQNYHHYEISHPSADSALTLPRGQSDDI